jgi:hypothetical protein
MFWQHSQTVSTFLQAKALYTSMRYFLIIAALVATGVCASVPVVTSDHSASRVHLPRVPRAKLFRANPHRLSAIRFQGTDPYDAPDDDYICSGTTRRPKVVPPADSADDELSAYVQVRLAVARARAMARYREIHT